MRKRRIKSRESGPWKRMAKCLDLPDYAVGLNECIEIWGGNTIHVEGARGIHTYEAELVKLQMKGYLLVLEGADFDLAHFDDGGLRVKGVLRSLRWEVN